MGRNNKSIWIAPLESTVAPLEIPLAKGGDAFWLDSRTVGHVVSGGEGKGQELYALSVKFETQSLTAPESPVLIGSFPVGTTISNFRYSLTASRLVFSAYVYSDLNLTAVKEQDDAWENRGNTAYVYDSTFVRHWDTWRGPKRSSLFSVQLAKNPDHKWSLGEEFVAPLKGTDHVSTPSSNLRLTTAKNAESIVCSTSRWSLSEARTTSISRTVILCTRLKTRSSLQLGIRNRMYVIHPEITMLSLTRMLLDLHREALR